MMKTSRRGYVGFSKSARAVEAERQGKRTSSALAKEIGGGATTAGVMDVLLTDEWHHTSKMFNRTYYYDWDENVERVATRLLHKEKHPESNSWDGAEDAFEALPKDERETWIAKAEDVLTAEVRAASKRLAAPQKAESAVDGPFLVKEWVGRGRYTHVEYVLKEGCARLKGDWVVFADGSRKAIHNVRIAPTAEDLKTKVARVRAWAKAVDFSIINPD